MSNFELEERLTVLHDDNGTFVNHSDDADNYITNSFVIPYTTAEDRILIGFKKPFANLYAEVKLAAVNNPEMTLQYFDGTSFVDVDETVDQTKGFSLSGFIRHKREQEGWALTTINGIEKFWLSITLDQTESLEFDGINTVFSDDFDLIEEYRDIFSFKINTDVSFISYHQSARKDIIQNLRNEGHIKKSQNSSFLKNISRWDVLEPEEIRRASTYLVLSKVFKNASDSVDGKWRQLEEDYKDDYTNSINTFILTLDQDDDGIQDNNEKQSIRVTTVRRI